MPRVLMIDDDWQTWQSALQLALTANGWHLDTAGSPESGIEHLSANPPDIVLLDLGFPEDSMQGQECLQEIRRSNSDLPVIILTNSASAEDIRTAVDCIKIGAWDYFTKSDLDIRRLASEMDKALAHVHAGVRRGRLLESFRRISGPVPLFKDFTDTSSTVCVFAVRLSGLARRPQPNNGMWNIDEWEAAQREWQRDMLLGCLSPLRGREIEIRFISVLPSDGEQSLQVVLLGRGSSPVADQARDLAEELWVDVYSLLRMNETNYAFQPVVADSELSGVLVPFEVKHALDIKRTGIVLPMRSGMGFAEHGQAENLNLSRSLQVSSQSNGPHSRWGSDSSRLRALCHALTSSRYPVQVSVVVSSSEATIPQEENILFDKLNLANQNAVRNRLAELEDSANRLCNVRIAIASNNPIPNSIMRVVGTELVSANTSLWEPDYLPDGVIDQHFAEWGVSSSGDPHGALSLGSVYTEAEATRAFQLPISDGNDTPGIKTVPSQFLYCPPNLSNSGCLMGVKPRTYGEPLSVRISDPDKGKHVYVLGQTGTGKSTLLQTMILSEINSGGGLCVVDPHGDLVDHILPRIPKHREKDVILFDPQDADYPIGLNLLDAHTDSEKDFATNEFITILRKVFDPHYTGIVGPQFEQAVRAAVRTAMELPGGGTVVEVPRILENRDYLESCLQHLSDPFILSFWRDVWLKKTDFHKSEVLGYVTSKFEILRSNMLVRRIVGQKNSGLDFRQIMDAGKILLVSLSKGGLGELNSSFLGTVLVAKLYSAALSRQDTRPDQRRAFSIYLDEFQNFTTETVESMLGEVRKYAVSLVLAHQNQRQLQADILEAVLGNVGTTVFFRPGVLDSERVAEYLKPYYQTQDVLNLPNWHAIARILVDNAPTRPFVFNTVLDETDDDPSRRERIQKLTRKAYAMSSKDVDDEILKRQGGV